MGDSMQILTTKMALRMGNVILFTLLIIIVGNDYSYNKEPIK